MKKEKMKKGHLLIFTFLLLSTTILGQNRQIDRMEMLYAQGHYKMVYHSANRLLNSPEYDYSVFPSYYKALSILQLAQKDKNYRKQKYNIDLAGELFNKVQQAPEGLKALRAHEHELVDLKQDMLSWAEDVNLKGDHQKHNRILEFISTHFEWLKDISPEESIAEVEDINLRKDISKERNNIIAYAKKFIGTPYVYGGTKPTGFDCSGYVSYVMDKQDIQLPRRSSDQYSVAKKLKESEIKPGDLVFFASGGGVNHVGIIYSVEKDGIYMIHASTGKGVTITNITKTDYWKKRIKGFGTYIK